MVLKKLEISGFKSFDKKTILEFPFSICAIVGPNGSGKSNIVDAIRWVLGEQSMKNLRSKKSEDLIFNGSEKKSRLSRAFVSLYLDNKDHLFPIDFKEVVIKRRIYRNGENEYFLNNSQVRLKDITNFCAKSRIGLRGYSIINQGMGDSILNASSCERKEIIEEAMGLKKFQLKKKEAQQKLLAAKKNLLQVNNLVKEITPHLRFLKRQVNKFQKKKELIEKLKNLQKEYLYKKLFFLNKSESELESKIKNLDRKVFDIEKEIQLYQKELKENNKVAINKEVFVKEKELSNLEKEKNQLERELGRIEAMIEFNGSEPPKKKNKISSKALINHLKEIYLKLKSLVKKDSLEELKKELNSLIDFIGGVVENIKKLENNKRGIQKSLLDQKDKISQLLNESNKKIETIKKDIQNKYEEDRRKREKYYLIKEKIENKKFFLKELKNKKENLFFRLDEFKKEKELLKNEFSFYREVFEDIKNNKKKKLVNSYEIEDLQKEIEKIKLRLELAKDIDPEIQKEFEETQKRYDFLTSQAEDLKQAINQLNEVIENLTSQIDKQFSSLFTIINKEFNKFFKLLFKGGNASLVYFKKRKEKDSDSDKSFIENDIYEEGIEIRVVLPKKKIKNLTALSGGERALCSLAVLFAIVGATAPPFLILDEIDAPLDESNSYFFIKILRELSKKTQFILITHNRATMQEADILYGITIQEGASKVFSLSFDKAKEIVNL